MQQFDFIIDYQSQRGRWRNLFCNDLTRESNNHGSSFEELFLLF